jgi:hypothetical protein
MDIQEQIKLGEHRNVDAITDDVTIKVPLFADRKTAVEFDVANVINVSKLFDAERQATDIYRIHGEIEYLSVMNDIPIEYNSLEDFFDEQDKTVTVKNVINDFDFYLVKPVPPKDHILSNGELSLGYSTTTNSQRFVQYFEVITEKYNFEINDAAFASNIFNEQQHAFTFNINIDLTDAVDGFGFPLTEIYLYAHYKIQENGNNDAEVLTRKDYRDDGRSEGTYVGVEGDVDDPLVYNKGDIILGNILTYLENEATVSIYNEMDYKINMDYNSGNKSLRWIYNPFIPITVRSFSDVLKTANTGSTSNDTLLGIPLYAKSIDNDGNVVWRDLLNKGFIDPLENIGVNYPFINNKNYIFKNFILDVLPDLDRPNATPNAQTGHGNTKKVFAEILAIDFDTSSVTPRSNLEDIGEKC